MENVDGLSPNTEETKVQIIRRSEWGALPDKFAKVKFKEPAKYVIVTWTGTNACSTKEECTSYVQELQKDHIYNKGLEDIRYNFIVGGDGNVYEGRGWNVLPEKHHVYPSFVGSSIEIGQIGRNRTIPKQEMVNIVHSLVTFGSKTGELSQYTGLFPLFDDSPESNLKN